MAELTYREDLRVPTGVHLRDARQQLFDAAERVLLRDGPSGLTSRAVTDEAGCAKGVLHRHFADFDAFLTDLVLDRAAQLETQARALRESAGTGTVADNLTSALTTLFGPVPVAIIPLITFRDELRARLRQARPGGGIAILAQATTAVSAYLTDERELRPHRGRRRHRLTHPLPGRWRTSPVRGPRPRTADHGNRQEVRDISARRISAVISAAITATTSVLSPSSAFPGQPA